MASFSSEEKKAIYNISLLMMAIDGHIAASEMDYFNKIAKLLEISETEQKSAAVLDRSVALSTLRSMCAKNKIIALKIFTEMMMADGKVDSREHQLLDGLIDDMDVMSAAAIEGLENVERIVAPYGR